MTKVRLSDDPIPCGVAKVAVAPRAYLDDDVFCEAPDLDPMATLDIVTVRRRTLVEYDGNGDPMFDWVVVVEGAALGWDTRTEIDDAAGLTKVVTEAMVFYDGDVEITESASVLRGTEQFRVTSASRSGSIVTLKLERIADGD